MSAVQIWRVPDPSSNARINVRSAGCAKTGLGAGICPLALWRHFRRSRPHFWIAWNRPGDPPSVTGSHSCWAARGSSDWTVSACGSCVDRCSKTFVAATARPEGRAGDSEEEEMSSPRSSSLDSPTSASRSAPDRASRGTPSSRPTTRPGAISCARPDHRKHLQQE